MGLCSKKKPTTDPHEVTTIPPKPEPYIDLSIHHGPDKTGKSIIIAALTFFFIIYCIFLVTSHVERDLPDSSDIILPIISDAKDKITNGIMKIPIEFIIFTTSNYIQSPQQRQEMTNEIYNLVDNQLLSQLYQPDNFNKDNKSSSSLLFDVSVQIKQLNNINTFNQLTTSTSIDDFIQADLALLDQSILRYIIMPMPTSINNNQLQLNEFLLGKYTHSFAFYPNTLLTPQILFTSNKSNDVLPHKDIQTSLKKSLLDTMWVQIQPTILKKSQSTHFKTLLKSTNSTPSTILAKQINERFKTIFGISVVEYLDLQLTPQSSYQLDFTMINHSAMVSTEYNEVNYQRGIDSTINHDILFSAIDPITSALSPVIKFTTSISTRNNIALFTPQPYTNKFKIDNNDKNNNNNSDEQLPFKPSIFTLDNSQVGQMATKLLGKWKQGTEFVPNSPTHKLLGPSKVINFVMLHPGMDLYNGCIPDHLSQHLINEDKQFLPFLAVKHNVEQIDNGKHNNANNQNYLQSITSSLSNTVSVPQWGTISILPPLPINNQQDVVNFSCQKIQHQLVNGLSQYQQYQLTTTIVQELKAIIGIGLPFKNINTSTKNTHTTTTTTAATTTHPAQLIPLPTWQRELFYRGFSLRLIEQTSETIRSTYQLIENSPHMPFPSHISRLLRVALELINDVSKSFSDTSTNTTTTITTPFAFFSSLSLSNELASAVFYHHDLLPQLFFPFDQTMAVYAPFFAPILVPVFTAVIKAIRAGIRKRRELATTITTTADITAEMVKSD